MEAYTGFARVYDMFMDNIPYPEWCAYLTGLLQEYGVTDGLVLDLGCGTGKMTRLLAAEGYDMIGVDLSEEMLEIALEQQAQRPDGILYLQQDMREFELYGTVRAIVSVCDSMNYLMEYDDLVRVLKLANNYLDPGGVFIFDLNTLYKYREELGEQTIAENREESSFIWENFFDEEERINEYDLTLFIREEDGRYQKYEETHYQKAYELSQVRRAIEEAGMELVIMYDAFTGDAPREDSERVYVIAREQGKKCCCADSSGSGDGTWKMTRKQEEHEMSDYIIRATAAEGQIRAFAATTRELVEYARKAHNTSPVATAALGRLLTGGAMMGVMMKGDQDLLTLKIEGDGPIGGLTVTADAKGNVKGYVNHPEVMLPPNDKGKLDVGGALGIGVLSVIRDIGLKDPYVGQTILVTGEIAEDLTYYFATSEQTPSSVALGVLMNRENTVRQAGGFILQMMPQASEEVISGLEEKLKEITSITSLLDQGMTPEEILEHILGDFGLEITDRIPAAFHCNCSKARIEKALISVGRHELQEMIDEGKTIEVNCHFCNSHYPVTVEELKELLEQAK